MTHMSKRDDARSGFALAAVVVLTLAGGCVLAAEPEAPPPMPAPGPPPAGHYQLEKSHASLVLRASHMGFSTYTTRFSRFDADLSFDPANIEAAKVVATIDANSFEMDAAPQVCLDIMKGANMLDTAAFPQIVFKSEKVHKTGERSLEIDGTLTLHGVTRPIVLRGSYNGGYAGMPGMDPQARIGFSAHGAFRRSEFGIAFGIPAPGSNIGVGDAIDFAIEAEFIGPPLAGPAAPSR